MRRILRICYQHKSGSVLIQNCAAHLPQMFCSLINLLEAKIKTDIVQSTSFYLLFHSGDWITKSLHQNNLEFVDCRFSDNDNFL